MGRKWKRRGGGGGGKKGNNKYKNDKNDNHGRNWSSSGGGPGGDTKAWIAAVVASGNAQLEAYYAVQGLHDLHWKDDRDGAWFLPVRTLDAWQAERTAWRSAMGRVLPASFRIHADLPTALQLQLKDEFIGILQQIKETVTTSTKATTNNNIITAKRLQFLPDDAIGYQLTVDRTSLRKEPAWRPLFEWLKRVTDAGHITRQETVSMIPPAVLMPSDIASSCRVLDMCAAPGSKTGQLLERLAGRRGSVIIANDANPGRAAILTTQLKRVLYRNPACLVTACPAQFFPKLRLCGSIGPVSKRPVLTFDYVLCDVPCTGDGTSRKNIDVWRKWTPRGALALHALQLQIATRAVQLAAASSSTPSSGEGGYVLYSTCSQNPMENEAVVAALLQRFAGQLELCEITLPGFRVRPGMPTWKVLDTTLSSSRRQAQKQQARGNHDNNNDNNKDEETTITSNVQTHGGETTNRENHPTTAVATTTDTAAPAKTQDEDQKKAEDMDVTGRFPRFRPTAMDEASLLQAAEAVSLKLYATHDEVPDDAKHRIRPTVFPPPTAAALHLERCVRVLPHDNDTGGFFVALLRKTGGTAATPAAPSDQEQPPQAKKARTKSPDLEAANVDEAAVVAQANEESNVKDEDDDEMEGEDAVIADMDLSGLDADNQPVRQNPTNNQGDKNDNTKQAIKGGEAYVPLQDDLWSPLIEYYGLDASPNFQRDCFMCRVGSESKVIHYVAPAVKAILDTGIQERIHVLAGSIKAFTRNSLQQVECKSTHRVAQEAVTFVAPYMTKRKISVSRNDFQRCLIQQAVPISHFAPPVQDFLRPLDVGSVVMVLEDERLPEDAELLAMVIWRCRGDTTKALVTKVDMDALVKRVNFLLGPPPEDLLPIDTTTDAATAIAEYAEDDAPAEEDGDVGQEQDEDQQED